jgi:glycosyltransferase involved in cell wall biosynthesis
MTKIAFFYPGDVAVENLQHVSGFGRLTDLATLGSRAGAEVMIAVLSAGPTEHGTISGLPSLAVHARTRRSPIGRALLTGHDVVRELAPHLEAGGFDALCFYGTTLRYTVPLRLMARRNRLTLIASVNEWGHRSEQTMLGYLLLRMGVRYVGRRFDKVIAISQRMADFFSRRPRLEVVRIPSIFDMKDFPKDDIAVSEPRSGLRDTIVLAYAGSVAQGKDATGSVIRALADLSDSERERFRFWIAGSSRDEVMRSMGEDGPAVVERCGPVLEFRGFLPRPVVREMIGQADYTVLLRPSEPYAQAAFPTKFAESLALGVPVIANLTSDLGEFLTDGVQGFVVDDETPQAATVTLRRILAQHEFPNSEMRRAAWRTGRQAFDIDAHIPAMTHLLERN